MSAEEQQTIARQAQEWEQMAFIRKYRWISAAQRVGKLELLANGGAMRPLASSSQHASLFFSAEGHE